MGALREKMIEEMKLRNFSPRTEQSYVSAMVGLVKYYRRSPDQLTQDEIRSYLLHLKERGVVAEFAQRGDLGDEVLLPSDSGVGRTEAVLAAKKGELAIAGGVKSQGSGAIASCRSQASRSLFADDGLLGGASGQRAGPPQTQRYPYRADDDPGRTGQREKRPLHDSLPTAAR